MSIQFTLTLPKPRNPVARANRRHGAGAHRPSGGAQRQAGRRALRQALREIRPSP
jgi:hypothetical protein